MNKDDFIEPVLLFSREQRKACAIPMKEDTSLITTFRLTGIFSIPVFLSVFWLELYDSLTFRVLFAFNSQTEWPQ